MSMVNIIEDTGRYLRLQSDKLIPVSSLWIHRSWAKKSKNNNNGDDEEEYIL